MQKILLLFVFILMILSGCSRKHPEWSEHRRKDEACAQQLLSQARQALGKGEYKQAHLLLDSMRLTYKLALDARNEGIPFADSLILAELRGQVVAYDSILQVSGENPDAEIVRQYQETCNKIKFYMRKLNHDTKQ